MSRIAARPLPIAPGERPLAPAPIRGARRSKAVAMRNVARVVVAAVAACLGSLVALDAVLVDHSNDVVAVKRPDPAEAVAAVTPAGGGLEHYVGHWISETRSRLIIARSGSVWADSGALLGTAALDGDGTHLVFAGANFRCRYEVVADGRDSLDWRLIDGTPLKRCPHGRFDRHFTF